MTFTLRRVKETHPGPSDYKSCSRFLRGITQTATGYLMGEGFNLTAMETSLERADYFFRRGREEAVLRTTLTENPLEFQLVIEAQRKHIHQIKRRLGIRAPPNEN